MFSCKKLNVLIDNKVIVKNFDYEFLPGFYSLTGSNGAGKTSFALGLAGHYSYKTTGEAIIDGVNILALPIHERIKAGLFVSLQKPVGLVGISVLNFLRSTTKMDSGELIKKAKELAELVGLPVADLQKPINVEFSGGEAKKLEFIQMCMHDNKVIVLDEIDSGLDQKTKLKIKEYLKKIVQDKVCIIISHQDDFLSEVSFNANLNIVNGEVHVK